MQDKDQWTISRPDHLEMESFDEFAARIANEGLTQHEEGVSIDFFSAGLQELSNEKTPMMRILPVVSSLKFPKRIRFRNDLHRKELRVVTSGERSCVMTQTTFQKEDMKKDQKQSKKVSFKDSPRRKEIVGNQTKKHNINKMPPKSAMKKTRRQKIDPKGEEELALPVRVRVVDNDVQPSRDTDTEDIMKCEELEGKQQRLRSNLEQLVEEQDKILLETEAEIQKLIKRVPKVPKLPKHSKQRDPELKPKIPRDTVHIRVLSEVPALDEVDSSNQPPNEENEHKISKIQEDEEASKGNQPEMNQILKKRNEIINIQWDGVKFVILDLKRDIVTMAIDFEDIIKMTLHQKGPIYYLSITASGERYHQFEAGTKYNQERITMKLVQEMVNYGISPHNTNMDISMTHHQ